MISDWAAIITVALVVTSYVWTVSFRFGRIEEKLDRLIRDLDSARINADKVPILDYRTTQVEDRLNKLEPKIKAGKKKSKP